MLLKSSESWGYAAIDLMCIDLFTGQAGFYKYGAAPSYIRSGRNVRRVKGMTMAAGVLAGEGEPPDVVRLHIRPGALAVIASDGVVTREDDTWLRRILLDDDGTDMRALARSVVHEAGERYGYKDDMTVLAIRLEERKCAEGSVCGAVGCGLEKWAANRIRMAKTGYAWRRTAAGRRKSSPWSKESPKESSS